MRAEALTLAPHVIAHLLEDDEDLDFTDDLKDVGFDAENSKGYWHQVDGDWGDPWEYGGSWYNKTLGTVLHFEGMESWNQFPEERDFEPDNIEVPPELAANLERRFPSDYVDPDGDLEWQQKQRNRNERERDNLIGHYQYARAAFLNSRKKHAFYEIAVEDGWSNWALPHLESIAQSYGYSMEEFESQPMELKLLQLGRHIGFEEIGSTVRMNKREAQELLGVTL